GGGAETGYRAPMVAQVGASGRGGGWRGPERDGGGARRPPVAVVRDAAGAPRVPARLGRPRRPRRLVFLLRPPRAVRLQLALVDRLAVPPLPVVGRGDHAVHLRVVPGV